MKSSAEWRNMKLTCCRSSSSLANGDHRDMVFKFISQSFEEERIFLFQPRPPFSKSILKFQQENVNFFQEKSMTN